MCTSWSSANQISNFKFSAFFRVLFALWSLKYPHPKSQQTPWVSTELEMVVNLSYSFIPLQKLSQKGVDRSVENPQKCAEPYTVPLARRGRTNLLGASKCPSASQDMIGVRWTLYGADRASRHQNALLLHRIWLAKKTQVFTSEDEEKVCTESGTGAGGSVGAGQFCCCFCVPCTSDNVSSSAWKNILFIWVKFPQKPYFHKNDLKV